MEKIYYLLLLLLFDFDAKTDIQRAYSWLCDHQGSLLLTIKRIIYSTKNINSFTITLFFSVNDFHQRKLIKINLCLVFNEALTYTIFNRSNFDVKVRIKGNKAKKLPL